MTVRDWQRADGATCVMKVWFRKRGYAEPKLALAGIRVRDKGRTDDAHRRLVADVDDSLVG